MCVLCIYTRVYDCVCVVYLPYLDPKRGLCSLLQENKVSHLYLSHSHVVRQHGVDQRKGRGQLLLCGKTSSLSSCIGSSARTSSISIGRFEKRQRRMQGKLVDSTSNGARHARGATPAKNRKCWRSNMVNAVCVHEELPLFLLADKALGLKGHNCAMDKLDDAFFGVHGKSETLKPCAPALGTLTCGPRVSDFRYTPRTHRLTCMCVYVCVVCGMCLCVHVYARVCI